MSEILFRGKTVCNGDWVYGGITWNPSRNKVYIHTKSDECEVIPKTVGQYTGLKSKNGTRIFEGDVVRFDSNKANLIVNFSEFSWQLILPDKKYYRYRLSDADNKRLEVVGNIFDNRLEELQNETYH